MLCNEEIPILSKEDRHKHLVNEFGAVVTLTLKFTVIN